MKSEKWKDRSEKRKDRSEKRKDRSEKRKIGERKIVKDGKKGGHLNYFLF